MENFQEKGADCRNGRSFVLAWRALPALAARLPGKEAICSLNNSTMSPWKLRESRFSGAGFAPESKAKQEQKTG